MKSNLSPSPVQDVSFKCDCCGCEDAKLIGNKNGFDLYQCASCKTIKALPFPTPEELQKFYSDYKGTTDYARKKDKKIIRCQKRIKPFIKRISGKKFVDVGCNYGFAVAAAASLGLEAVGIDVDDSSVGLAKEHFSQQADFHVISVEDYANAGHKADMVYSSEVIEHVLNPDSFVAAIAKILKKGGILYLTTPDGGHWSLPRDFTKWEAVMPPEHLSYFTRKGMKALLERHGFKDIKIAFNLKPGLKVSAVKQ